MFSNICRVSILQLAVNDKIFIVDMLKLYVTDSAENVLREFFSKFFTSKHVVKIGEFYFNFNYNNKTELSVISFYKILFFL